MENEFGSYLMTIRRNREMGMRALAHLCGITVRHLSQLERGELAPPSDELILKLAAALNMSIDNLFFAADRRLPRSAPSEHMIAQALQRSLLRCWASTERPHSDRPAADFQRCPVVVQQGLPLAP